jgi:hypothetical protein
MSINMARRKWLLRQGSWMDAIEKYEEARYFVSVSVVFTLVVTH